jgi:NAD(P) transhydrogenase subunit alpha
MTAESFADRAAELATQALSMSRQAAALAQEAAAATVGQAAQAGDGAAGSFMFFFTVFVLACFVGYYVVWAVTPALHSPLMSVTNAISSVIVVGALIAAGPIEMHFSKWMGFFAVLLASVNIFGGFIVTQRMLQMYKKRAKK